MPDLPLNASVGTMGGGSQTSIDTQLAAFGDKVLRLLPGVGERMDNFGREQINAEMARLLQNPQALALALEKMPPGPKQRAILAALQTANIGAGSAAGAAITP